MPDSICPTPFLNHPKETTVNVRHLNQRQLADRWSVSEATLERWRSEGIGPVYMKLQGRVLYRVDDVESYEEQSMRRSPGQRLSEGSAA